MGNYVKNQNKITIYYDGNDQHDIPSLCLRAARSLLESDYEDCVYGYGDEVTVYAKKNKAGITVRQLA